MGTAYERELKGILQGDVDMILKVTKSCSVEERQKYREIEQHPFMVVRAAGSFGMDLIAIRGDIAFPIEEKSSAESVLRFGGGRLGQQADWLLEECRRARVMPIYAFRLKGVRGDSWRIFTLPIEGLDGRNKLVHERIPVMRTTKQGNFVMEWEQGMQLCEFLHYLCVVC